MNSRPHAGVEARLRERLAELTSKVREIEAARRAPLDPDSEEQALELEPEPMLAGLEQVELREIAAIEVALRRLADGRYGDCSTCGEAIEPSRLEALPYAIECSGCAGVEGGV